MGREVMRVPMDFDFPLGASYHDAIWEKHKEVCSADHDDEDNDCDVSMAPPKGEGWQLWQTVSDGPVTPVFATAEELIDYMCQPSNGEETPERKTGPYPPMPVGTGWKREIAEPFVKEHTWAPSFVTGPEGLMFGAEWVVRMAAQKKEAG